MKNLIEKLRSHRISVTPQRLAVLSVLESRRDHPTAEQIYLEVRRQLPAVSFNTVYKTLEVLCQKGLAIKVNPLHERARYDCDTSTHAHLVCRECQFIVDLPEDLTPPVTLPVESRAGFQVERHSLIFWGLCPRCQKKELVEEEET